MAGHFAPAAPSGPTIGVGGSAEGGPPAPSGPTIGADSRGEAFGTVPAPVSPAFGPAGISGPVAAAAAAAAPSVSLPGPGSRGRGGPSRSSGVKARRAGRARAGGSGITRRHGGGSRAILTSGQGLLSLAQTTRKSLLGV